MSRAGRLKRVRGDVEPHRQGGKSRKPQRTRRSQRVRRGKWVRPMAGGRFVPLVGRDSSLLLPAGRQAWNDRRLGRRRRNHRGHGDHRGYGWKRRRGRIGGATLTGWPADGVLPASPTERKRRCGLVEKLMKQQRTQRSQRARTVKRKNQGGAVRGLRSGFVGLLDYTSVPSWRTLKKRIRSARLRMPTTRSGSSSITKS